jgi:hypothetical protein
MENKKLKVENRHLLKQNGEESSFLRTINFKLDLKKINFIVSIVGCTDHIELPNKIRKFLKDALFKLTDTARVLFIMGGFLFRIIF